MMRAGSHLPVSIPVGNAAKKERGGGASRSAMFPLAEIWIHAIPLLVLLCFFVLWWLSRPGIYIPYSLLVCLSRNCFKCSFSLVILAYGIRPYCFNSQESWDKEKEMASTQVKYLFNLLLIFGFESSECGDQGWQNCGYTSCGDAIASE